MSCCVHPTAPSSSSLADGDNPLATDAWHSSTERRGGRNPAIAERAVGQLLRLIGHGNEEPALWYWSREARSSAAEVDYLAAPTGYVLPIEVKAGTGGAMRSLHIFMAGRKLAWAARFNSAAPMVHVIDTTAATGQPVRYSLLSLPAYAVECLPRLAREMDAESLGA